MIFSRRWVWPVGVWLLLCASAAPAARADEKGSQRVSVLIPFKPMRGHGGPLVQVRFNESVSGTFLVDTGATDCHITDSLAKKLGLRRAPVRDEAGHEYIADGYKNLYFAYVKQMQIGPLVLKDASFLVMDDRDRLGSDEEPIDGLIGTTVLAQFALILDAPQRRIVLISPGGLSDEEIRRIGFGGDPVVKMEKVERPFKTAFDQSGSYVATVELRGENRSEREKFVVDTGADDLSLSYDAAKKLGLVPLDKSTASTFYGSFVTNLARVPAVDIGGLVLRDCPVSFPGDNEKIIEPLLGQTVLAYCVSLFDLPARKLYLKPVLPPLAPDPGTPPDPQRVNKARLREVAEIPDSGYFPAWDTGASRSGEKKPAPDEIEWDTPARIEALQKGMKNEPGDAERWIELGALYDDDGEKEKAREAFERAAALFREQSKAKPGDAGLLARLSLALGYADQDAEAEAVARQATALAPNEPRAWIALGWALHSRASRALTGESSAVDISNDLREYQALIARLRRDKPGPAVIGEVEALLKQAREQFDRAVAVAPQSSEAYAARAEFIENVGLGISAPLKEARGGSVNLYAEMYPPEYHADLEQAARFKPDDADVLREAALAAARIPVLRNEKNLDFRPSRFFGSLPKRYREAAQDKIKRLTELSKDPDKNKAARALEALGVVQRAVLRDDALAEATLRQALALDPTRARATHTLAWILTAKGRNAELADLLTARLSSADTVQNRLLLARTLGKLGQWDQAAGHLEAALKLRPDDYSTNIALAALSLRQSDSRPGAMAQAGNCLLKAQQALGNHPGPTRKREFALLTSIYLGLTGKPGPAKQKVLEVLNDDRSDTDAREILAALML